MCMANDGGGAFWQLFYISFTPFHSLNAYESNLVTLSDMCVLSKAALLLSLAQQCSCSVLAFDDGGPLYRYKFLIFDYSDSLWSIHGLVGSGGSLGCDLSRSFSKHQLHKLPSGSLSNCFKGLLGIFPSKNYRVGMRSCTLGICVLKRNPCFEFVLCDGSVTRRC
jgi:hypothetical protein